MKRESGVVYFIRAVGTTFVKIGVTALAAGVLDPADLRHNPPVLSEVAMRVRRMLRERALCAAAFLRSVGAPEADAVEIERAAESLRAPGDVA